MDRKVFKTDGDMARTIARLGYSVCENLPADNLVILGIYTGGAVLARRISDFLKKNKGPCIKRPFVLSGDILINGNSRLHSHRGRDRRNPLRNCRSRNRKIARD